MDVGDDDDIAAAGMVVIDLISTGEAPGSRGTMVDHGRSSEALLREKLKAAQAAEATRVQALDQIMLKPTSKKNKFIRVCNVCDVWMCMPMSTCMLECRTCMLKLASC